MISVVVFIHIEEKNIFPENFLDLKNSKALNEVNHKCR